jgi:acetylornithine deacetylase/succinyl-diaminopimelate desuccinylase-like protein
LTDRLVTYCAAAKLLKAQEGQLGGTVLLIFQPAEEGGAGGKRCPVKGPSSCFTPKESSCSSQKVLDGT